MLERYVQSIALQDFRKRPRCFKVVVKKLLFHHILNQFFVENIADNMVIMFGVFCEIISLNPVLQNGEGFKLGTQTDLMPLQVN